MATLRPFRAIRPNPGVAAQVAAVPYDVVDVDEARALAAGNPLSFLHVSRAEIDLHPGIDPHADKVYQTAAKRYQDIKHEALVTDAAPSVYIYRLRAGGHAQTGVAACFSIDEYNAGVIRKHEGTRKDKEDDRTRHIMALGAQTGPVFLMCRPHPAVRELVKRMTAEAPLVDFRAIDGVEHTLWRVADENSTQVVNAFADVDALYIADGHHRAASAARACEALPDSREAAFFLGVAFPSDEVRILPYNRVVKDLNGRTPENFLGELSRRGFAVEAGPAVPEEKGQVSVYLRGGWRVFDLESAGTPGLTVIDSLDCNLLQEKILAPVLGIGDIRTDPRIDFVGGIRGTKTLEELVDSGRAAVAFSMFPASVLELMAVSDAGAMMPPKSTWFEPKLRDGLLVHEI